RGDGRPCAQSQLVPSGGQARPRRAATGQGEPVRPRQEVALPRQQTEEPPAAVVISTRPRAASRPILTSSRAGRVSDGANLGSRRTTFVSSAAGRLKSIAQGTRSA